MSLDNLLLIDMQRHCLAWLYVVCSRTRKRAGFFTAKLFGKDPKLYTRDLRTRYLLAKLKLQGLRDFQWIQHLLGNNIPDFETRLQEAQTEFDILNIAVFKIIQSNKKNKKRKTTTKVNHTPFLSRRYTTRPIFILRVILCL